VGIAKFLSPNCLIRLGHFIFVEKLRELRYIEDVEKFKFLLKNKIAQLPKTPGVYAFNKGAKLLYIGKAINLRDRVKNHQGEPVLGLAKHIAYIETDSEIEALILEAKLIKKYQPKFNVTMRKESKMQNYEMAGKIKNQIKALEKVLANSRIFQLKEPGFPSIYQERIEAYDISNIQGKEATGSMVVFVNDKPDKSQYRKFKIRTGREPNDVAMLKEVLERRFNHKEWPYPDLILIDGGKAQLNIAKKICSKLNLKQIKIMALAKKNNELYIKEKESPVLLKTLPRETFNLMLNLRDEAHRFARKYHHKLRDKVLLG
ncbi:MAG: hypothetical protein Q8P63_02195, partial [Candidatus Nealsonbacteria bacterium]|nr:hypothetical protein [Candidatus Nealsonbacteria bacterium]